LNARQFIDVLPMVVERVHYARSGSEASFEVRFLQGNVSARHGEKVAHEAVEHFRRIFEGAKKGGMP
jgi:hypothetical protein